MLRPARCCKPRSARDASGAGLEASSPGSRTDIVGTVWRWDCRRHLDAERARGASPGGPRSEQSRDCDRTRHQPAHRPRPPARHLPEAGGKLPSRRDPVRRLARTGLRLSLRLSPNPPSRTRILGTGRSTRALAPARAHLQIDGYARSRARRRLRLGAPRIPICVVRSADPGLVLKPSAFDGSRVPSLGGIGDGQDLSATLLLLAAARWSLLGSWSSISGLVV